jgi:hypothetical protein
MRWLMYEGHTAVVTNLYHTTVNYYIQLETVPHHETMNANADA